MTDPSGEALPPADLQLAGSLVRYGVMTIAVMNENTVRIARAIKKERDAAYRRGIEDKTLAAITVLREIASEPWSADPWVYAERMSRRAEEVLAVIAPPEETP